MAIREELTLDISQALNQLDDLERQLDGLFAPVARGDNEFESLNRELDQTVTELKQIDSQADRTGRELETTGRRGSSAFLGMGATLVSLAGALAAFSGFQAIGRGIGVAIEAASNLAESVSKTNVVFGEFADEIKVFAEDAPQALGLSEQAALEATATFGNLFTALGLSQEAAADLSPDIVQLASDLASFNNIPVGDALEKLRSGLVGEAEPLRALGVAINESVVSAKALELGLVGANGELTEAAKVQARYALILEQTTNAQGDFARTADGIANRQRTLNAEFEDFTAAVGEALLPAFESLLSIAPQLLEVIEGLVPAVEGFAQSFGDVVTQIQPFLENVTLIQQGVGAISDAFGLSRAAVSQSVELFTSLATLRFGDFIDNIGETGDVIGDFIDRIQDRSAIIGLADDIKSGADAGGAFIQRFQEIAAQNDITEGSFERLAATAGLAGDELQDTIRDLIDNAAAYDLDAQAVQALRLELAKLLGVENAVDFARKGRGSARQERGSGEIQAAAGALDEFNLSLESLSTQEAVAEIAQLATSFTALAPAIQELPGVMGAVRDALRTEGDEVLEDLDGFIEDLQRKFTEQNQFQGNLALLRALGLDDLAATFEAAGLEASQALADAIADPAAAAEAERLLEDQAATEAQAFKEAFNANLAGFIATLPVDVILQQIQIPEIQAALNIGPFGGGQGVGDVIVNINNPTTTNLPTDANRAAQVIGSVTGSRGAVNGRG